MHAASLDAIETLNARVDRTISGTDSSALASAVTIGTELFDAVEALESDLRFRVAVADTAVAGSRRRELMTTVFNGHVSAPTLELLGQAAELDWSNPRELRTGLIVAGRRAILKAAEVEGSLERVENELFELSLVLEKEPELTMLLSDRTAGPDRRRELLAAVLYGKVSSFTEALALQVVGRPERNPIDDVAALVDTAASLRGLTVAHVVAAATINEEQTRAIAVKVGEVFGRPVSVHTEVDPTLLGGATVQVGNEKIDASLSGRLDRLRAELV